ncbi:uncharacterized protein Dana_GF11144, isoform G [Drosophila ananassae]|uniref:Uncharacterized protein, isoform G n=1 Tax=Drosophila ananassae TaxID=7217 RepID=A0A0P8XRJ5_DROAN|nr:uncharacterized protein LOC6494009 isoform X4 [Drosophila ananassae]KPU77187.1 uncharacterized protein Dana_GF11144, isoform G [Drosophila ananassae]
MAYQFPWCEFGVLLLFFLLILYFSISRCVAEKRKRRARTVPLPPLSGFNASGQSTPVDGISHLSWTTDRQGNVFTVPEERSHNRYGDIFFIEPGSEEANRIREQLEKDEKELPSYDEVMRMCNLTTPTSAAAPLPQSALPEPLGPIGIPALPAPPYSETDPHLDASGATVIAMEPVQPSTSRAAQILPTAAPPATPSPATQTTV